MKKIDLNVDIGEGFAFDSDLLLFASSANICCGVHAGDWDTTRETIGLALDAGVRIGMHPGYPDRENMGRRMPSDSEIPEFLESVIGQVERFFNFVPAAYLKPHGALYADSQDQTHESWSMLRTLCRRFELPLLGLPGTAHESIPNLFYKEGFCDRGYGADGRLLNRNKPGALLNDPKEIVRQSLRLACKVDSLCLHGDAPKCVEFAELIYKSLLENGFEIEATSGT